jgi:hypothetical protein
VPLDRRFTPATGKELTLPAAVRCEVQGKFRMRNIGELLINLVRIAGPKRLSGPAKRRVAGCFGHPTKHFRVVQWSQALIWDSMKGSL